MIPANRGWVAVFENDDRPNHTKPVVAWDDNGAALILDEKLGALRPARDFTNFLRVVEDDDTPTVAAVPGGGWMIEYTDDSEPGGTFRAPVVAWAVDAKGWATPLGADQGGGYAEPVGGANFHRLIAPDEAADT